MECSDPLGIENRVVSDAQRDGQPTRVVSGARTFATAPEVLWDAVTNLEKLACWFNPITGDLKLGGRYQLEGNAGGEIIRCERAEIFEVTWEFAENVSWLMVRLEPKGDGTRMTLEHTMTKDEASESHWNQYGPGATGVGWDLGFLGLGLYLNSDTFDRKEAEAWSASEPGKEFIRHCAKAWGVSHISSGEEPDLANAMAEKTAKAYTGE